MKERTYGIILGIVNIVLLTVCGVLFLGKDKNAPEILLSNADFVYAAQKGEEVLFQGVTAIDAEDGELTGSVVIEKIVTDMEKETATITYGVADSAGNVGKATCTVAMDVPEEVVIPGNVNGEESVDVNGEDTEGALEESDGSEEDAGAEDGEETTLEENAGDGEASALEDEAGEEAQSEGDDAEASVSEGMEEAEREALPTAGEAANRSQNVTSRPDPGRPSMALRTQEVTVKAGQTPAWVQVIEGLYDDKDNYETLLKSLQVKGTYEKDKAGTYDVTVTVTDAEGNESNAYPMKIIVEAWQ